MSSMSLNLSNNSYCRFLKVRNSWASLSPLLFSWAYFLSISSRAARASEACFARSSTLSSRSRI
jgi:hypothetical protein